MTLSRAAQGFTEASRSLRRSLESTRGEWNDDARRLFDRQFTDDLVREAQRVGDDLQDLAAEAASALAAARSVA